jgi:hypothetical protein
MTAAAAVAGEPARAALVSVKAVLVGLVMVWLPKPGRVR